MFHLLRYIAWRGYLREEEVPSWVNEKLDMKFTLYQVSITAFFIA